MADTRGALEHYLRAYAALSPHTVTQLAGCFAPDGRFKDPFNDVRGPAAVQRVFEHMFEACSEVHFDLERVAVAEDAAFIAWTCRLRLRRHQPHRERRLQGVSVLRFDADGRVTEHIDHWDAAEQVYAQLPVIGWLLRRLRRLFETR